MTVSASAAKALYTSWTAVALVFTAVRLWIRQRDARLWWDDLFAFLSALFVALTMVGGWLHFDMHEFSSRTTRIAAYYILAEAFYGGLWCARLSILYSLIRLAMSPRLKTFLFRVSIVFALAWAVLLTQILWVCLRIPGWTHKAAPQCPLTTQVVVLQLVADISSDLLLIAVPARMFLISTLPLSLKLRLVVIFGASVLTTITSIVHAYYIIRVGGPDVLVAAIVEIAVSLIVCNLSVVANALHRVFTSDAPTGDATDRDAASSAAGEHYGISLLVFRRSLGTRPSLARTKPSRATTTELSGFVAARGRGPTATEDEQTTRADSEPDLDAKPPGHDRKARSVAFVDDAV